MPPKDYPIEVVDMPKNDAEKISKIFRGAFSDIILVGPDKYFFYNKFRKVLPACYNFASKKDDVFVMTFPKCGTTWTQEMTWLIANNLDYEKAKELLDKRSPFMEADGLFHEDMFKLPDMKEKLDKSPPQVKEMLAEFMSGEYHFKSTLALTSPRTIKTHLSFSLHNPKLLDTSKVVYVVRDPRDVIVSWYYHHLMMPLMGYTSDFPTFLDLFTKNQVLFCSYLAHAREAWLLRDHPNLMLLQYEEMKKDLPTVIRNVAKFIGKSFTEEDVKALARHLSFESMKKNPSVNMSHLDALGFLDNKHGGFIRKGKSGGWRDHITPDLEDKYKTWLKTGDPEMIKFFGWE